jgi:hypothetical protein
LNRLLQFRSNSPLLTVALLSKGMRSFVKAQHDHGENNPPGQKFAPAFLDGITLSTQTHSLTSDVWIASTETVGALWFASIARSRK